MNTEKNQGQKKKDEEYIILKREEKRNGNGFHS
jgi:hypothetical protein